LPGHFTTIHRIHPNIIKNPIEVIVFPNPFLIVLTTVPGGSVVKARKIGTRKSAIKAFSFRLEVSKMMAIILTATRIETVTRLIDQL